MVLSQPAPNLLTYTLARLSHLSPKTYKQNYIPFCILYRFTLASLLGPIASKSTLIFFIHISSDVTIQINLFLPPFFLSQFFCQVPSCVIRLMRKRRKSLYIQPVYQNKSFIILSQTTFSLFMSEWSNGAIWYDSQLVSVWTGNLLRIP